MTAVRQGRVQAGGTSSPLIEAGPPDAREAVVFVHGNPGSSSDWTALVAAAGELGRAVAIDMPGFGKAQAPAGFGFQVSSYADFLEVALAELQIDRVHLVLHDFGGPFGLLWGATHPQAWASVVLVNVGVLPGYTWHSMAKRWRTPVVGELVQAWIPRSGWRRTMQKSGPRRLPEEFVDKMYDDYDRATRRTVLKLYRNTPDPGQTAAELGSAIAELHKPALVVWGAADPFLGVEYAERQREFFDVQDVVVLPQSSHWPFQDDPPGVERAVLPFLVTQLGAGVAR
ncbi:MAG TPA: alpha/beta hydrolase [Solirubrobacteraceae bacterium]|nr:alpha/beta hydrolase [Solirubrobacteraceae bacterium]